MQLVLKDCQPTLYRPKHLLMSRPELEAQALHVPQGIHSCTFQHCNHQERSRKIGAHTMLHGAKGRLTPPSVLSTLCRI